MLPYEIGSIACIDRSEVRSAQYAVEHVEGPPCLRLVRQELQMPTAVANWGESELRSRMQLWRRNLTDGASFWGAFLGERLVSFALISERFPDQTAELYSLFVDAAHRRKGIGSELLARAEQEAVNMGAHTMSLFTALKNAGAIDFFLSTGYQVIGIHDSSTVKHKGWELRLAKALEAK